MVLDPSARSVDEAPTDFVLHLSQRLRVGSSEAVCLLADWVASYEPSTAAMALAETFAASCGQASPPRR